MTLTVAPLVPDGAVVVQLLPSLAHETSAVLATPPKVSVVAPGARPSPRILICVPPAGVPSVLGVIEASRGTYVKRSLEFAALEPLLLDTITSTRFMPAGAVAVHDWPSAAQTILVAL